LNKNEKLFFTRLKEIFVGTKIEGDSGFVNLMNIKSTYFDTIFKEINKEIEDKTKPFPKFKEELFDKLNTFTKKYFSESGSIYFTYTPLKSQVFEKIYDGQNDVTLFWKTNMLYYLKTEQLFQNLSMTKEISDIKYDIKFDVSTLKHKTSNEKKDLVYNIKNISKKQIIFSANYSNVEQRVTKNDQIIKILKEKNIHVDEDFIKNIFKIFEMQNTMDYFINTDANKFLKTQFDYWMKNYLFDTLDFEETRLKQLKILQEITYKIIDFIAQFEDELVKIWNKPRFALNGNYVITLNKIFRAEGGVKFLKKIFLEKQFKDQIQEWKDLSLVKDINTKDIFDGEKLEEKFQYLTIDTKYFPENIKLELLSLFKNIEKELDGWLIKSENYQALNTLLKKFNKKIDCIYIDPPFNTPFSEIIYENNFKHSTWLTMISNRIELGKKMLLDSASMVVAIDYHEQERLGLLLEHRFPEYNKTCVSIIHNPAGKQGDNFSNTNEYAYFLTPLGKKVIQPKYEETIMREVECSCTKCGEKFIQNIEIEGDDTGVQNLRNWGGDSERVLGNTNTFYPIYVKDNKIIRIGDIAVNDHHPKKQTIKIGDEYEVWPIDIGGVERKWRWGKDTIEKVWKTKPESLIIKEKDDKIEIHATIVAQFKTVWGSTQGKYSAKDHGTKPLTSMGLTGFSFPKSIYNVKDCIFAITGNKKDALILDFFGGSGTTAHSTMMLNKEDGGKRKFIITEMGDHFHTIIIPRIKKVAFSFNWSKGIPKDSDGKDIFFKYYEFEQYDQILRKVVYEKSEPFMVYDDKSIYQQYVFFNDLKMLKAAEINAEKKKIKIDFSKIYPDIDITNVDIAETLSNIKGKSIKSIEKSKVIFDDGEEVNYDEIDFKDVKSLIWW
jgi:adenine-specific DNA-methyltransferase